jgi:hypothetical protein
MSNSIVHVANNPLPVYPSLKTGDTTYQVPRIDVSTHTLQTIEYEHHEIHAGSHFEYTDSVTLASAGVQNYLITTPNTTKWAHMTMSVTGSAITEYACYRGGDRVGETLQTSFNNDHNSDVTATTIIHKGITGGTEDGTKICGLKSGGATQQSRQPLISQRNNEFILNNNKKL